MRKYFSSFKSRFFLLKLILKYPLFKDLMIMKPHNTFCLLITQNDQYIMLDSIFTKEKKYRFICNLI